jgi:hypothetical protein
MENYIINFLSFSRFLTMADQQFFLKWNDFQTNMVTSFRHLRDEKSFTDVSCEGDAGVTQVNKIKRLFTSFSGDIGV